MALDQHHDASGSPLGAGSLPDPVALGRSKSPAPTSISDHAEQTVVGLVLHGLLLKGLATPAEVAELVAVDEREVECTLEGLRAQGLVTHRSGERPVWSLTADGRVENERLLRIELDAGPTGSERRAAVEDAYRRFRALNPRLLSTCTDWQVKDRSAGLLNDHADPAYDEAVIDALIALHTEARPILADLGTALDRFRRYELALTSALDKVRAGATDWFAKPRIASYHTLWFELHEDLLATLGLDRHTEAASA